tara:strand:- start:50 stop:187 length:138 start_codon:yes stop_codon:yes gene_type:complete
MNDDKTDEVLDHLKAIRKSLNSLVSYGAFATLILILALLGGFFFY